MKEITTDHIRTEINRLGALVIETGLFHPSGVKLHSAGEPLTLTHAKALHDSGILKLFLMEFGEDERTAKRSLGVEMILPANVAVGDQLAEDLRTPGGQLLLAAGTTLDEAALGVVRKAPVLAVPVRHRKLAVLTQQAEDYLVLNQGASKPTSAPITRIMRITTPVPVPVRYLMIPRARVLVGIADDLMRTLVVNALISEGHEVIERRMAGAAVEDAPHERPHILLIDLAEASVLPKLRATEGLRNLTVLVCAEEEKSAQIQSALYAGANDWIPRPPSREVLSERIKGCQDILLRRVQLAPSLGNERRKHRRGSAKGECELKDLAQSKLLPVNVGDLVDVSEGGVKIAYNMPRYPCPWAYSTHGVHPRHPMFPYASSNPMGQDVKVIYRGPNGAPVEKPARVAHLAPGINNLEVMGLSFPAPPEPRRANVTRKF